MKNGRLFVRSQRMRNRFASPNHCEMLESRLMLTAAHVTSGSFDLVPTGASAAFKGAIITGSSIKGTVKVSILNEGAGDFPGTSDLVAFLRPQSGGADVVLTPTAGKVGKIGSHKSANVTLKNVTLPTSLTAGTYLLGVKVLGGNAGVDTTFIAPFTITAAAGFVTLGGSLTSKIPLTFPAGKAVNTTLQLSVTDQGNIATTAIQTVNVSLLLRPTSGGSDVPLITNLAVPLKTLKAKTGKDAVKIPLVLSSVQTNAIPAGTYNVIVTLTPVTVPASTPVVIPGPSITITGGTVSPAGSIFKHGDTITFNANTQLTGTNFIELGSFSTNTGATGSYQFTPAGLFLTYSTGDTDANTITLIGTQKFFDPTIDGNGTKVIFSFDSAGAFATFPTVGNNSRTAFAKLG